MRIMIIDDSKGMRMFVRRALTQAGYADWTIEEAESAVVALDRILASPPDLVFCDWNMPHMTGIDLLTTLRTAGSTVRLGFVTSEASAGYKERATKAGASFFVTKPFTTSELKGALDPLL